MSLDLVPDIWSVLGVERHVGLLSSRKRGGSEEERVRWSAHISLSVSQSTAIASNWMLYGRRGISESAGA